MYKINLFLTFSHHFSCFQNIIIIFYPNVRYRDGNIQFDKIEKFYDYQTYLDDSNRMYQIIEEKLKKVMRIKKSKENCINDELSLLF